MPEQSGRPSQEPFATYDPASSSWRTWQQSFPLGNSLEPLVTWPRSGMTRSGDAYELPTLAPRTAETAASSPPALLKTPAAQLAVNGGAQHPDKRKAGGHGPTLDDEVMHLLPTPAANDGARGPDRSTSRPSGAKGTLNLAGAILPTPTSSEGNRASLTYRRGNPTLIGAVLLPTPTAVAYGSNQSASTGAAVRPSLNSLAPTLLPAPNASLLTSRMDLQCSGDGRTRPNKLGWAVAVMPPTGASTGQPWTAGLPSLNAPHQTPPLWWDDDEADDS
jgi:hypothetical protein